MIASQLIDKKIIPINPNDTIDHIEQSMELHQVYHLPYVTGNKLIGIISEEKLHDNKASRNPIELAIESVQAINHQEYFFEIWTKMAANHLTCMPVIDDQNQYLGSITQQSLVEFYTASFGYSEPGSIILIAVKKSNYSLSKIAHIVEEEHCVIMSSFLTEKKDTEEILLTIKVNCIEVEAILNSFHRFDIEVVAVFSEKEYSEVIKERYHGLMNYLNV